MKRHVWVVEWKVKGKWKILTPCTTRRSARAFIKHPLNAVGLLLNHQTRVEKYIPDNENLVYAYKKYISELEKERKKKGKL